MRENAKLLASNIFATQVVALLPTAATVQFHGGHTASVLKATALSQIFAGAGCPLLSSVNPGRIMK